MEKELEVREKKLSAMKTPAVIEAEAALEAIRNMESWESEARMLEMQGGMVPPVSSFVKTGLGTLGEYVKEKHACINRLREVETQLRGCRLLAEEAKLSILQGEQGINLNHISLKNGGPRAGLKSSKGYGVELEERINSSVLRIPECGECQVSGFFFLASQFIIAHSTELYIHPQYCLNENFAQLCANRRRVRHTMIQQEMLTLPTPEPLQFEESLIDVDHLPKERKKPGRRKGWSKAMAESGSKSKGHGKGSVAQVIPAALIPELCRKITANGTRLRDEIIKQFTSDHPEASIRQCLIKFQELTTKYKPDCVPQPEKASGRAWVFFLRPRFYHLLEESERPNGWEAAAAVDEELYAKECVEKAAEEQQKSNLDLNKTADNDDDDTSNVYASTIGSDDDSITEPLSKKTRVD